jgi:D-glycero-D-manno-heptose 1,7-bisphosphate phosphatase
VSYNLSMYPAIFLDRDGVIIENKASYVRSWKDVSFYPQALKALRKVYRSPYKIFIVTNQSAIGRGIISLREADIINQKVVEYIEEAGGRIDDVFMCPHSPDDHCNCRKPLPGMFLKAKEKYQVKLEESILVGDALSDIIAGQSAGVLTNMLVRTGRGENQIEKADAKQIDAVEVCDDLNDAFTRCFSRNPWWNK